MKTWSAPHCLWFAALMLALPLTAGGSHEAHAQGRIVDRHGDWQIRCERPVGAPSEQCALVQNVEAQDRANVGLTVIFLRTADRQARILRVLAPLGVLLPSGLGLSIDENEIGLAGFVRCLPEGCIAEVELDDGLIERFAAGSTATFVIFQTPEQGIGIPISLNGFTEGFSALDNPPPPPEEVAERPVAPPPSVITTQTTDAPLDPNIRSSALEADERTAFDRLLEDPLFPYVAAGVFLVLATVLVLVLVARGRRTRRYDDDEDYVEAVAQEEDLTGYAGRQRAPRAQADPRDDGLDALEDDRIGPQGRPRVAGRPKQRQLPPVDGRNTGVPRPAPRR